MLSTVSLTTDQFIAWSANVEQTYELIDGIPVLVPPENYFNTTIARYLARYLESFFSFSRITHSIEIELDTGNTRIPDLSVVSDETARQLRRMTRPIIRIGNEPPLIAIEIVSPSSGERDYEKKLKEYASVGLREYWIVDPHAHSASIYVLSNSDGYTKTGESVITGSKTDDLIKQIDIADSELS